MPLPWLLTALIVLFGCSADPEDAPAEVDAKPATGNTLLPNYSPEDSDCGTHGQLTGKLYGALTAELNWSPETMHCEGMPRPDGEGARLRFSATAADRSPALALIIAIPALKQGGVENELTTRVTIIEEGNGRFFSTANLDSCWTDVSVQRALDESGRFEIEGTLYCITPLAEVNGDANISIPELRFASVLDWSSE